MNTISLKYLELNTVSSMLYLEFSMTRVFLGLPFRSVRIFFKRMLFVRIPYNICHCILFRATKYEVLRVQNGLAFLLWLKLRVMYFIIYMYKIILCYISNKFHRNINVTIVTFWNFVTKHNEYCYYYYYKMPSIQRDCSK